MVLGFFLRLQMNEFKQVKVVQVVEAYPAVK